ncbi:MAG: glycosyltransferase [Verrucomicrobia bacterium]|nr:glycosyltransferase [Verrucomicrobiota bacterium]
MDASIVILTLNAGTRFRRVLEAIDAQRFDGSVEVLVLDSGSTDGTLELAAAHNRVRVHSIANFGHGRTRNEGARLAAGEFIVYLTQDALPLGERWLANLLAPFDDPKVAATYSRQVPYADATPMERFFLSKRFPDVRVVRPEPTKHRLGLYTVFFSNVSSAIRRTILLEHPFDDDLIMSEDQQFARDVIAAGWRTVYEPASVVRHSHRYTLWQVFTRYFDSLYSLEEIFDDSTGNVSFEGIKYTLSELWHVLTHHLHWLPYLLFYDASKAAGTLAGHLGHHLPIRIRRALSMHKNYWHTSGEVEHEGTRRTR